MSIVHTTEFKFPTLKQKYRMQQKIWPLCSKLLTNIFGITNNVVDHSKKGSQYVRHHTIQIRRTVKVTAWRRRSSY